MNAVLHRTHAFTIESCDDCFIPGHLIIRPLVTVSSMIDLPQNALENLGSVLALSHRAVEEIIKPIRIYTLSFCELLPSLHFHVFPRTAIMGQQFNAMQGICADTVNGALFFDWARGACQEKTEIYGEMQRQMADFFRLVSE